MTFVITSEEIGFVNGPDSPPRWALSWSICSITGEWPCRTTGPQDAPAAPTNATEATTPMTRANPALLT